MTSHGDLRIGPRMLSCTESHKTASLLLIVKVTHGMPALGCWKQRQVIYSLDAAENFYWQNLIIKIKGNEFWKGN